VENVITGLKEEGSVEEVASEESADA